MIQHTVLPGEYPSLMFMNVCDTTVPHAVCNSSSSFRYRTIGPSWRTTINLWCDSEYWAGDVLEVYCGTQTGGTQTGGTQTTTTTTQPTTTTTTSFTTHTVIPGEYPSLMFQNVCGIAATCSNGGNSSSFRYRTIGPSWRTTVNRWCDSEYWAGDVLEVYCGTQTGTQTGTQPGRTPNPGDTIYFTIDDGPTHTQPLILQALRDADVKVTFFDTAINAYRYQEAKAWLADTIKDGHTLASHADTHYMVGDNCDYYLANVQTSCGIQTKTADMLSGALKMISLLDSAYASGLLTYQQYIKGKNEYYSYSRLPCTNTFEIPYLRSLLPNNDISQRLQVHHDMLNATFFPNSCRPHSYGSWTPYGWDALNNNATKFEVYGIVNEIEKGFRNPNKPGKVIFLFHTWDVVDLSTQSRLTSALLLLKQRGYLFGTIDSY